MAKLREHLVKPEGASGGVISTRQIENNLIMNAVWIGGKLRVSLLDDVIEEGVLH